MIIYTWSLKTKSCQCANFVVFMTTSDEDILGVMRTIWFYSCIRPRRTKIITGPRVFVVCCRHCCSCWCCCWCCFCCRRQRIMYTSHWTLLSLLYMQQDFANKGRAMLFIQASGQWSRASWLVQARAWFLVAPASLVHVRAWFLVGTKALSKPMIHFLRAWTHVE